MNKSSKLRSTAVSVTNKKSLVTKKRTLQGNQMKLFTILHWWENCPRLRIILVCAVWQAQMQDRSMRSRSHLRVQNDMNENEPFT